MATRFPPIFLFLLMAFPALAGTQWQDLEALRKGAIQFAQQQGAAQPGTVTVNAVPLDPRLRLPACQSIDFFIPTGNRLWGNSNLGARCNAPSSWTVYIPLTVSITSEVVFAARPLGTGQKITEADILLKSEDITQFASGVITDPRQALGKTATISVAAGYPLRLDMLRAPYVIQQGQSVKILARGQGFQVNAEGKALTNAAAGQIVSVRSGSGQIIKGTAREGGIVEVPF
ncbi:MAG: flagellar basal body P-ring formation protein FlgA [Nitrosomonadales bacterium]|nr:MAG: flagellar basal body P-ring formation protein FlgA [Nitrosomonadales bacterium]